MTKGFVARTPAVITSNKAVPLGFGGKAPTNLSELRNQVAHVMEVWLKKTRSERTRTAYRKDIEQFLQFLKIDPRHVEEMTRIADTDVSAWRDYLAEFGGRPLSDGTMTNASNATVARKLTSIRSFFSFLQSYGYRGANPAHPHFVSTPEVSSEGQTPAIAPKEMIKLLDEPSQDTPLGIRDRAILSMFAYMALRVEELSTVTVGKIQIDGEHTIVRIKGKGEKDRKGVLPPVAATAVRAWIDIAGIGDELRGPLFRPAMSPRGNGFDGFKPKPMTIRAIQKLMKNYCKAVGISKTVSVHSLRVTAATEADRAGVPLNQIQKWLGHKDPRTTLRYIHQGKDLDRSPAYLIRYG